MTSSLMDLAFGVRREDEEEEDRFPGLFDQAFESDFPVEELGPPAPELQSNAFNPKLTTALGYVKEGVKDFASTFMHQVSGIPSRLVEGADVAWPRMVELAKLEPKKEEVPDLFSFDQDWQGNSESLRSTLKNMVTEVDPESQQRFMGKFGAGFGSFLEGVIPGAIALDTYGQAYKEATAQGKDHDQASNYATTQAFIQEAGERIGMGALKGLIAKGGKLGLKVLGGAVSESTQEFTQEGLAYMIEKVYGVANDTPLGQRLFDAWSIGGLIGGGATAVGSTVLGTHDGGKVDQVENVLDTEDNGTPLVETDADLNVIPTEPSVEPEITAEIYEGPPVVEEKEAPKVEPRPKKAKPRPKKAKPIKEEYSTVREVKSKIGKQRSVYIPDNVWSDYKDLRSKNPFLFTRKPVNKHGERNSSIDEIAQEMNMGESELVSSLLNEKQETFNKEDYEEQYGDHLERQALATEMSQISDDEMGFYDNAPENELDILNKVINNGLGIDVDREVLKNAIRESKQSRQDNAEIGEIQETVGGFKLSDSLEEYNQEQAEISQKQQQKQKIQDHQKKIDEKFSSEGKDRIDQPVMFGNEVVNEGDNLDLFQTKDKPPSKNDLAPEEAKSKINEFFGGRVDTSKMIRKVEWIDYQKKKHTMVGPDSEVMGKMDKLIKDRKVMGIIAQKFIDPRSDEASLFQTPDYSEQAERGSISLGVEKKDSPKDANGIIKTLKKYFTKEGHLPKNVYSDLQGRNGKVSEELKEVAFTLREFRDTAKGLSKEEMYKVDQGLKGELELEQLPEKTRAAVSRMRNHIDNLSQQLIESGALEGELTTELVPGEGDSNQSLAQKIYENIGFYATRTYRVHDDPNWSKKVPVDVRNKAKAFVRQEFPDYDDARIDGIINELLYHDKGGVISSLSKGSKLGSKALGILKKRKVIPQEIRALWGEYKDADVNYARSIERLGSLIANHQFLTQVKNDGMGKYLFDEATDKHYVKIAAEGSKTMSPLNGLYTTEEIADAFNNLGTQKDTSVWLRTYMKAISVVRIGKTVLSQKTHVRNFIANPLIALANGHGDVAKLWRTVRAISTDIRNKGPKEYQEYIKKLTRLNVLGESARSGELKAIIQDATQGDIDKFVGSNTQKVVKGGRDIAEKLYKAEDDFWKIYAFENEVSRYKKAYPEKSVNEIDKIAADIVRNTTPTYSTLPKGIQALRRFPFTGTFVSFPAAMYRATYHTMKQATVELKNPKTKKIGAQRLAGLVAAATITAGVSALTAYNLGINKKKQEAIRRFFAPWTRNSDVVWAGKDDDKFQYTIIDLGYTDPYSVIKKPINAFLRGDDWESGFRDAISEAFAPFFSEDILTAKVLDITRNTDTRGKSVYGNFEPTLTQVKDSLKHLYPAFEPGGVYDIRKASTGDKPIEDGLAMMTGQRLTRIDIPEGLMWKSRFFNKDYREAGYTTKHRDDKEKRKSYIERNQQGVIEDFKEDIEAAALIGMTKREIGIILKEAKVSEKNRRKLLGGL